MEAWTSFPKSPKIPNSMKFRSFSINLRSFSFSPFTFWIKAKTKKKTVRIFRLSRRICLDREELTQCSSHVVGSWCFFSSKTHIHFWPRRITPNKTSGFMRNLTFLAKWTAPFDFFCFFFFFFFTKLHLIMRIRKTWKFTLCKDNRDKLQEINNFQLAVLLEKILQTIKNPAASLNSLS